VPRQNRVTPFGAIIATPERGTFLGNRGILHDAESRILRAWQLKRWLVCVLEFKGRKRTVMMPNRYTELFFLDEATALAAGHRPCAECRYGRFLAFCNAWKIAHAPDKMGRPTAKEIDDALHSERVDRNRAKRTHSGALDELPDGVFVTREPRNQQPLLVWRNQLLEWTAGGYREHRQRPRNETVTVLTPRSTVAAIRAGYVPEVHFSVGR
jgi:hypothetical protein